MHQFGGGFYATFDFSRVDALQFQGGRDIVIDAHRRIIDELLIDHRDVAFLNGHAGDIVAIDQNAPAGWWFKTCHNAHQRRFARQGPPEKDVK